MACGWGDRAGDVVNDLTKLVHDIQPGLMSGGDAGRLAETFTRAERLCGVIKTICAKRAAECATWSQDGFRSEHEWFARMIGTGLGAARDQLELAEQVADQPEVAEAWKAGDLSPAQTKEITKAAHADPSAAGKLIKKATTSSHKGLKDACRQTIANARSAEDEAAKHRRLHQARYCRLWVDDEGAGRIDAKLTPEALATIRACLDPFARHEFDLARAAGRRERHEAYVADALVAMARAAAAGQAGPYPADPAGPGRPSRPAGAGRPAGPGDPPGPGDPDGPVEPAPGGGPHPASGRSPGPPATVIAVVSLEALRRGHTDADECCLIDGIGPVPVATVRTMATDAFLAAVVTDGIDIRSVAHTGRQVTAHQRTALTVRDPVCVVPGCHTGTGLEIDHVAPWAATKITTLDQLARLCRFHHHQKTYEGFTLRGPPGRWEWIPPRADHGSGGEGDPGPPSPEPATLFGP